MRKLGLRGAGFLISVYLGFLSVEIGARVLRIPGLMEEMGGHMNTLTGKGFACVFAVVVLYLLTVISIERKKMRE